MMDEKPTELHRASILPNSIPKNTKGRMFRNGQPWIPIYCANCGADGGFVPEEAATFAFYLCDVDAEKWSPLAGLMAIPDEVFWEKVKQTQIETFGRELTGDEIVEALKDEHHVLTKLARDRSTYKKET